MSVRRAQPRTRGVAAEFSALTEVHVPRPEVRVFPREKLVWRGFRHISRNMFDYDAQAKYYGNWCGNRLAVTIYVNTKTLLFSHSKKRRFV